MTACARKKHRAAGDGLGRLRLALVRFRPALVRFRFRPALVRFRFGGSGGAMLAGLLTSPPYLPATWIANDSRSLSDISLDAHWARLIPLPARSNSRSRRSPRRGSVKATEKFSSATALGTVSHRTKTRLIAPRHGARPRCWCRRGIHRGSPVLAAVLAGGSPATLWRHHRVAHRRLISVIMSTRGIRREDGLLLFSAQARDRTRCNSNRDPVGLCLKGPAPSSPSSMPQGPDG